MKVGRIAVALLAVMASCGSLAATRTWTGAGSTDNWSEAANWSGGLAPANGDDLVFPSGAGRSASRNDLANTTYASLSFTGYPVCISGTGFTLTSPNPLIVTAGNGCLAMPITLAAPGTVVATVGTSPSQASLEARAAITLTGNTLQFQFAASNDTASVNGTRETAPSAMGCSGAGAVFLHGSQAYSGFGSFSSCDVVVDSDSSLGATAQGTDAQLVSLLGNNTSLEPIRLIAPGDPTYGGFIFTNDAQYLSNYTAYLDGQLELTYAGVRISSYYVGGLRGTVTGAGGFTLLGPGTLQLWRTANNYAGATLVAGGTLALVANEVVPDTSDLQVGAGGTLAMGNTGETVRSLNLVGNLDVFIDGPGNAGQTYSQLIALQGVTLGGSLQITANPSLPLGYVFTLINNASGSPVSGTFDGMPEGAIFYVNGNRFAISYAGGDGNDVTLTVLQPIPPFSMQDMWWGGSAENGWGMSVVQHRDVLFSVIYAYDSTGRPTWFVFPGGNWNTAGNAYTGSLYQPQGTPYYAYDASRFAPGNAVGTATLTFLDSGHMTLDYNIGGLTGHKSLTRQSFGAPASFSANYGDMWWGGVTQNGWGVAILQQYASFFSVWFTYDANGFPTWYVMPSGSWQSDGSWQGRMYRTTGSPWVGTAYDPSRLQVFDVGPYRLRFVGDNTFLDYSVDGRTGTLQLDHQPF